MGSGNLGSNQKAYLDNCRCEAISTTKLGTLESVDLRHVWLHEARDFTPWLAQQENLQLLSNTLSLELELEGMEIPVGPYKVDIVANEITTKSRAIIENQLERTDHDHLGKLICYAAGLQAKIVSGLRGSRMKLRTTRENNHPPRYRRDPVQIGVTILSGNKGPPLLPQSRGSNHFTIFRPGKDPGDYLFQRIEG
jgi:hypothetical protein